MGGRKEAKAVECEENIRSITNRPRPSRESFVALRGGVSASAAWLKRYVPGSLLTQWPLEILIL
jgi:hypothetical protein